MCVCVFTVLRKLYFPRNVCLSLTVLMASQSDMKLLFIWTALTFPRHWTGSNLRVIRFWFAQHLVKKLLKKSLYKPEPLKHLGRIGQLPFTQCTNEFQWFRTKPFKHEKLAEVTNPSGVYVKRAKVFPSAGSTNVHRQPAVMLEPQGNGKHKKLDSLIPWIAMTLIFKTKA